MLTQGVQNRERCQKGAAGAPTLLHLCDHDTATLTFIVGAHQDAAHSCTPHFVASICTNLVRATTMNIYNPLSHVPDKASKVFHG